MLPGSGGGLVTYHFARLSALRIGISSNPARDYSAVYDYDADDGRMSKITGPGIPGGGVTYSYLTDSHLVEKVQYRSNSTTVRGESVRSYEANRDLLSAVENKWGTTPVTVSKYAYANDDLARRTSCVRTGSAFDGASGASPDPHNDVWGYNDRNELVGSLRFNNGTAGNQSSGDAVATLNRLYGYDPIGNRKTYKAFRRIPGSGR